MAKIYRPDESITENIVYIGVPNVKSLNKALKKLRDSHIPHFSWHEPDPPCQGFNSIATAPISGEQRSILDNYRVWSEGNPCTFSKTSVLLPSDNSRIAQGQSIPTLNREMVDTAPPTGASSEG